MHKFTHIHIVPVKDECEMYDTFLFIKVPYFTNSKLPIHLYHIFEQYALKETSETFVQICKLLELLQFTRSGDAQSQ